MYKMQSYLHFQYIKTFGMTFFIKIQINQYLTTNI